MFDLPDSKRVRRDELASPPSSSPPLSPQHLGSSYFPNAGLLEKFFSIETFTAPQKEGTETHDGQVDGKEDGDGDVGQEFEFRLFRRPVSSRGEVASDAGKKEKKQSEEKNGGTGRERIQATKIRIRSPTPAGEGGDGRFVVPFRGWGFYFSEPGRMVGDGYVPGRGDRDMEAKRSGYLDSAVTGEQVLEEKGKLWEQPGCHLPWRVTHIKATTSTKQKPKPMPSATSRMSLKDKDIANCLKRKNLGKKRRIILRKALAAQAAAKEADQEKKTRRNREKKVKRRQREREKKAAATADPGADTRMEGIGSDSGSE